MKAKYTAILMALVPDTKAYISVKNPQTEDSSERAANDARRKAVLAFLPVYDDLERALAAPCQDEAYRRGIELMMQNLLSILAGLKVLPMQSLGKCFNPTYHEAVSHVEDKTVGEERIVQVVQKQLEK